MQKNQHFVRDILQFSQVATWQKDKFCSFPIDTARLQENQRLETRQVGAPKRAFRARLPPIFTLSSFKIDVFLRVFLRTGPQNRCFMRGFRQFSAHRTKCHACHGICTLSPLDAALPMRFTKNTQHDTSKVLRLPRKITMDTSKVLRLPRKLQHIFWTRRKSIAPATQNDFRHVTKHLWMSRSATPATRNEATKRWKPPKMTPPAELPIGTAIRSLRERLRTVADGCERLRPQTQRRANTPSTPRPPEWNGNPCYAFGKKPASCHPIDFTTHFLWVFPAMFLIQSCDHMFHRGTGSVPSEGVELGGVRWSPLGRSWWQRVISGWGTYDFWPIKSHICLLGIFSWQPSQTFSESLNISLNHWLVVWNMNFIFQFSWE